MILFNQSDIKPTTSGFHNAVLSKSYPKIPAGSMITMEYLWGWTDDGLGMTDPVDISITLDSEMTVLEAQALLHAAYTKAMADQNASPRDLFLELVTAQPGLHFTFHWGS